MTSEEGVFLYPFVLVLLVLSGDEPLGRLICEVIVFFFFFFF